jgi:hypothetical protein
LIKISNSNDNFNFISIENSPSLDPGQIVFIVGYPLFNPKNGMSGSITKGFFFFLKIYFFLKVFLIFYKKVIFNYL